MHKIANNLTIVFAGKNRSQNIEKPVDYTEIKKAALSLERISRKLKTLITTNFVV